MMGPEPKFGTVVLLIVGVACAAIFFLMGVAVIFGWFLHWLVPSIDFGSAVLVAMLSIICLVFVATSSLGNFQRNVFSHHPANERFDKDDDDDDYGDTFSDEDLEMMADHVSNAVLAKLAVAAQPHRSRRK